MILQCFDKLDRLVSAVDRWLVIRTNQFINEAGRYMGDYSTREVVTNFEAFVNDISNFYIRVNRSRFWSTELSEDKINAYTVLFYAIKSITGIMAPIVPFIAETTWQKFIKRYSDEMDIKSTVGVGTVMTIKVLNKQ